MIYSCIIPLYKQKEYVIVNIDRLTDETVQRLEFGASIKIISLLHL